MSRLMAVLVPLCFLSSCAANGTSHQPAVCNDIVSPRVLQFPLKEAPNQDIPRLVSTKLGISDASITSSDLVDGSKNFVWKDGKAQYNLWLTTSGEARLQINSADNWVRLEDLTRCFGPPSVYRSGQKSGETPSYEFDVWYPSAGLGFHARMPSSSLPNAVPDLTFGVVTLVQPGNLDEVLRRAYPGLTSKAIADNLLPELRPWPSNKTDIQVSTKN